MSATHVSTRHDVSPEAAIGAIREHAGPILLDLDETLYLRNSTEDYIDTAQPRVAALVIMRILDVVKPWRWTGGEVTRDVWRVRSISMLFPGTPRRWERRVTMLAVSYTNARLMAALPLLGRTAIITTVGFRSIVAPLVAALGLPEAQIVAARQSTFADRRNGKLRLAVDALGHETVAKALVLTDSEQDILLLDACARPLRAIWPEARFRHALSGVYLPGQYLSRVKRPGTRYILRGILQEDFALWVLSSIELATLPFIHVFALLWLLLSFWAIYERGYVDNDLVAARFEEQPKLTAAFLEAPVATPRWQPWLWAFACGGIGVGLIRLPGSATALDYAVWAAVLGATHWWFHLYNRLDKGTRVWLFVGLQFARAAAFVALVSVTPIGAAALGAHVLAKWVPYHAYRIGGKAWPEAPFHLIRLIFFLVLAVTLYVAQGAPALLNVTALALLAWTVFRARQELAAALSAAHRIDRPSGEPPHEN